jgi:uncharacterized membrane protein YebE (DUF533 family)
MDKTEILLLVFAVTFLAYRLYQKYKKKGMVKPHSDVKTSSGSLFSSSSKDDDYEPYSKK